MVLRPAGEKSAFLLNNGTAEGGFLKKSQPTLAVHVLVGGEEVKDLLQGAELADPDENEQKINTTNTKLDFFRISKPVLLVQHRLLRVLRLRLEGHPGRLVLLLLGERVGSGGLEKTRTNFVQ